MMVNDTGWRVCVENQKYQIRATENDKKVNISGDAHDSDNPTKLEWNTIGRLNYDEVARVLHVSPRERARTIINLLSLKFE